MAKNKTIDELITSVEADPQLQERLKQNPVDVLKEISQSGPAYTGDKLVYRIVVAGFVGVLFLGIIYFIYQYQRSIQVRTEYSAKMLKTLSELSQNDSLALKKIAALGSITGPTGLNGTTPDGIVAVFTAIIGALAGLFAPSPLAGRQGQS